MRLWRIVGFAREQFEKEEEKGLLVDKDGVEGRRARKKSEKKGYSKQR